MKMMKTANLEEEKLLPSDEMIKMIIVMRKDLNMRKGKIAAQAGHAVLDTTIKCFKKGKANFDHDVVITGNRKLGSFLQWYYHLGQTKICVYVNSEKELLELVDKAKSIYPDILYSLVYDSGRTEFHGETTLTCMAFEPLPGKIINQITGDLPLY